MDPGGGIREHGDWMKRIAPSANIEASDADGRMCGNCFRSRQMRLPISGDCVAAYERGVAATKTCPNV